MKGPRDYDRPLQPSEKLMKKVLLDEIDRHFSEDPYEACNFDTNDTVVDVPVEETGRPVTTRVPERVWDAVEEDAREAGWEVQRRGAILRIERRRVKPRRASVQPRSDAEAEKEKREVTNRVFVVHGHDREAVDALKDYLRVLRLHPFEWEEARRHAVNGVSSSTLEIVEAGIDHADAVILLFTPDERTELRDTLVPEGGDAELRHQPRPNVLFEAGWAMSRIRRKAIIVEARGITRVSDLDGINAVRLQGTLESFDKLHKRLQDAGCTPSDADPVRLSIQRFKALFTPVAAPSQGAPTAPSGPSPDSSYDGYSDTTLIELMLDRFPFEAGFYTWVALAATSGIPASIWQRLGLVAAKRANRLETNTPDGVRLSYASPFVIG